MPSDVKGKQFLNERLAKKPKLYSASSFLSSIKKLWQEGLPPGDKTGWQSLDVHYTVLPGQFSVFTGWPSSGKSEFLDALLVNLSRQGWKFAMFSFENQPVELHIGKLLEKLSGKPFGQGPTERMTQDEVDEYTHELDQSFYFAPVSEERCTMNDALNAAEEYFATCGDSKRGLVVDPWNELEHWVTPGMSETQYISHTLSTVRNWARLQKAHVWIVAHPKNMPRESNGKLPIPRPDMISGSQHWWNKADCCVTVYRDLEKLDSNEVEIYVQKVRFKHIGKRGRVVLKWDYVTGRYHEPLAPTLRPVSEWKKGAA